MTIASSGQASTHKPHMTQRSMSMSKRSGYFSYLLFGCSPASIVMHSAGHAVAHMKQATHLSVPSARFVSWWMPRKRGEYWRRSSGYWIVGSAFRDAADRAKFLIVTNSRMTVWNTLGRSESGASFGTTPALGGGGATGASASGLSGMRLLGRGMGV